MKIWDIIIKGVLIMLNLGGLALSIVPAVESVTQGQQGMLGLEWAWWSIIGTSIIWITMMSLIIMLMRENRRLKSPDVQMEMERKELEIKKLKANLPDVFQTVGQDKVAGKEGEDNAKA